MSVAFAMLSAITACDGTQPQSLEERPDRITTDTTGDSIVLECPSVTDYEVFVLTADIWRNAWITALEYYYSAATVQSHSDFIKSRSFDKAQLQALLDQCPECTDVRFYFADRFDPPDGLWLVPDLMAVNANRCVDVLGDSVVLSDSSGATFISIDEGEAAVQRWASNWQSGVNQNFVRISAYTYERATIQSALDDNLEDHLRFDFAARVAPPQSSPLIPVDPNLPEGLQGYLKIDMVIEFQPAGHDHNIALDFAQPCPELCNYEGRFYTSDGEE